MIEGGREIVYVDESTFNLWQYPNRSWLREGMTVSLSEKRGKSMTVIGAISKDRGLVHYEIVVGSNNADTFSKFLTDLRWKCRARKSVVVLDNLTVHKASKVIEVYNAWFKEMFVPPYSCTLNPIERLWSLVKTEWRNTQYLQVAQTPQDVTDEWIQNTSVDRLRRIMGK